jgi:hypothetical protein
MMSPSRKIVRHSYPLRKARSRSARHAREPRWISERKSARIRFIVEPAPLAFPPVFLSGRKARRAMFRKYESGGRKKTPVGGRALKEE